METYYDKSRKERILLEELFNKIYKEDFKYYHTPIDGMDTYDSVVTRFEKDSFLLKDTHIYEVKIREAVYTSILLERKKFQSLIKVSKKWSNGNPVSIYYVSCHPNGTFVFRLDPLHKYEWIKEVHNVSSTEDKGTVFKEITYLDISNAKYIDIRSYDIEKIDIKKEKNKQVNNVIMSQNRSKCLFEWLTNNQ